MISWFQNFVLNSTYTATQRLRDKVYGSLKPMQVEGRAVSGRDFALNIERWVLYGGAVHVRSS